MRVRARPARPPTRMSNEKLERGLQASVKIFEFSKNKLAQLADDETECRVTRDEMTSMKKAAAAMNRALTALVRESHDAENRLTLELHMLRGIMKRENTDRDANRARVYELFRRFNASDGGDGASASTVGANPLNAPTPTAVAIDKALAGLERLEQSMRDVSPVGRVNIHGAGLLAAKLKRDALVAAAAAEGQPGTSSEC